jgi:phage shock protein C
VWPIGRWFPIREVDSVADENDIQRDEETPENEAENQGGGVEEKGTESSDAAGPRSKEPDPAEAAADQPGPDEPGPDQPGPDEPGPDEPRPEEPRAQSAESGPRRLQRSTQDRFIAGVCGGLGEYFRVDPLLIRLAWVIATLAWGVGIIAYVAAWIFVPEDGAVRPVTRAPRDPERSRKMGLLVGTILIIVGLGFLFEELGFRYLLPLRIDFHPYDFEVFLALVIIGVGVWLLLGRSDPRSARKPTGAASDAGPAAAASEPQPARGPRKRLTRSLHDRKLAGVCGGLASYLDIDPSLVRVAFVIVTVLTHFLGALVYVAMAILVPEEEEGMASPPGD